MGVTAEKVAERYDVDRAEQDRFAARSQALAQAALASGVLDPEIVAGRRARTATSRSLRTSIRAPA